MPMCTRAGTRSSSNGTLGARYHTRVCQPVPEPPVETNPSAMVLSYRVRPSWPASQPQRPMVDGYYGRSQAEHDTIIARLRSI